MRIDQVRWQAVVSCTPDTKVSTVRALLDLHEADGVLLIDSGVVMGCVSKLDLQYHGLDVATGRDRQAVGPYGHGSTFIVTAGMDVQDVLSRMRRNHIPIMPVQQNGALAGIVSIDMLTAGLATSSRN